MNTESTDNKKDEDSSTKQIFEYYRKYSQSRDLPKYFLGTSLSYLPEIVDDEENPTNSNIRVQPKIVITKDQKLFKQCELEQDPELSPTGSVASNRKLEWDNLGDIGYNNAKIIQKSASLPSLTQLKKPETEEQPQSTNSITGNNVKLIILPYTSSSEEKNTLECSSPSCPVAEKEFSSTTTTKSSENQTLSSDTESSSSDKKIVDFKQSLEYLKKKIGMPHAHSTPIDTENIKDNLRTSDTPFVKKSDKPAKKLNLKDNYKEVFPTSLVSQRNQVTSTILDSALNSKKKVINLCLTKPLLLDCSSKSNVKQLTVGIQTKEASKIKAPLKNQGLVTFYKHSDSTKTSSDSKSASSNVVDSKCDSFEYVKNDKQKQNVDFKLVESIEETGTANFNFDKHKTNSENFEAPKEKRPDEVDLKTCDTDIQKSIYILQRLINSKKYDSSTKKRYIKKILQKITDSKYLEDSSTSSELFYPKTDHAKILHDQLKHSSFKNEKSSSTCQSQEEQKLSQKKKPLDSTDSDVSYPKEKKLGSSQIVHLPTSKSESKPSISNVFRKEIKVSQKTKVFSCPDKVPLDNLEIRSPESKEPKKTLFTVSKCQEVSSSEKSSPSYQNWKELKTISEKMFESNGTAAGAGDQIAQFADKEREFQLNWIEREMSHLGKLKYILEGSKKPYPPENIKTMTTTSVYMVAGSNNAAKRNYVIETQLGAANSQQRNFRINGQNYIVQNPDYQKDVKTPPVTADIEVCSTDKETNIKVTTFCNVCKRAPCVCVTDFLQGLSNPFKVASNMIKEHLEADKMCSCCSCSSTSSSSSSSKKSSKICIICHKSPCTCCACKKRHDLKTCSVCQLYSCMCVISPKNSTPLDPYTGTFIPTKMTKPLEEPKKICKFSNVICKCGLPSGRSTKRSEVCSKCGMLPCICGLSFATATIKPEISVCCKCGMMPCICQVSVASLTKKSDRSALPPSKTSGKIVCCKCDRYPCNCGLSFATSTKKSLKSVCYKCDRDPCVCALPFAGTVKMSEKPLSSSSAKKCVCSKCAPESCICGLSVASSTEGSGKSICGKCDRYPCVCGLAVTASTKKEKIICGKCDRYPCVCGLAVTAGTKKEKIVCGKCDRYPCVCHSTSSSDSSKQSDKKTCSKCGIYPCFCELFSGSSTQTSGKKICNCAVLPCVCGSSSSSSKSSSKRETAKGPTKSAINALSKLFVDCKCGPSQTCNCNFVDQLLKHFNRYVPTTVNHKNVDHIEVQTVLRSLQTEGVQVCDGQCDKNNEVRIDVCDNLIQTEPSKSENRRIQQDIAKNNISSQTEDRTCASVACGTENPCIVDATLQAGVQNCSTATVTHRAVLTASAPSKDSDTLTICYTEEKGTEVQLPSSVDKCVGISKKEEGTQSHQINTVDGATSSRMFTADSCTDSASEKLSENKGTSPEIFQSDKNVAALSTISSVDRGTYPSVFDVEKATDGAPKPTLNDQGTSPKTSEAEKSVDVKMFEEETDVYSYSDVRDAGMVESKIKLRGKGMLTSVKYSEPSTANQEVEMFESVEKKPQSSEKTTTTFSEASVGSEASNRKRNLRSALLTGQLPPSVIEEIEEMYESGREKPLSSEKTTTTFSEASVGSEASNRKRNLRSALLTGQLPPSVIEETEEMYESGREKPLSSEKTTITFSEASVGSEASNRKRNLKSALLTEQLPPSVIEETEEMYESGREKPLSSEKTTTTFSEASVGSEASNRKQNLRSALLTGQLPPSVIEETEEMYESGREKPLSSEKTTTTFSEASVGSEASNRKQNLRSALLTGQLPPSVIKETEEMYESGREKPLSTEKTTTTFSEASVGSEASNRKQNLISALLTEQLPPSIIEESDVTHESWREKPLSSVKTTNTFSEASVGSESSNRKQNVRSALLTRQLPPSVIEETNVTHESWREKPLSSFKTTNTFSEASVGSEASNRKQNVRSTLHTEQLPSSVIEGTEEMYESGREKPLSTEKTTITTSEIAVGATIASLVPTSTISTNEVDKNEAKQNEKFVLRTSVDVQTDLLSKDIKIVGTSMCSCSTSSSSAKKCIYVYTPIDMVEKLHRTKTICLNDPYEKKPRLKCRNCSRSQRSKSSESKSKEKCPHCNMNRACYCNHCGNNFKASKSPCPNTKCLSNNESPADTVQTASSSSDGTCCLCGDRMPTESISLLRSNDQEFPVCKKCLQKRPILTSVCFAGPKKEDSSSTSSSTKATADHFRRAESYCTCKRAQRNKNFDYCPHCKNQLRRTHKSRNGIAYTLTLEEESPEKFKKSRKKPKKLEEIKMKVPHLYNRKQHKNRENRNRKDEEKMKRLESGENSDDETIYYSTNNETAKNVNITEQIDNKTENNEYYTLQEYLLKNRPHFVDAAEYRRLAVVNNKNERELNKDDLKLKFLEDNAENNKIKRQRLFSEQEMREITKRNYKKLPEVQQKLVDQRQQKLRNADKFMANMLKTKIQNCVLKGKSSFPIDTNVVNVYK